MVRSTYLSGIGDDRGKFGNYEQASVDDDTHGFNGKVEPNPEIAG